MSGAKIQLVLMAACVWAVSAKAYDYDPNDFATQVIEYVEGIAAEYDWVDPTHPPFNNPANALGRPTIDTTGENWKIKPVSTHVPVVNVYPAFRFFELVTVGLGGKLVLKFNHPVRDDENNPYGIDLIVFGNAQQKSGTGLFWENKDPADFMVNSSDLIADEAVVSVSQDGNNWYSFSNGPYADSFAPTFGRVYDPNHYDPNVGSWNFWWGHPTDPTLPLDPAIQLQNLVGKSVAEISQMYGESAGGTGYDLSESGFEWVQYVKIEGRNGATPEVDSVADVSACGDWKHPFAPGAIMKNGRINYGDLDVLSCFWLSQVSDLNSPAAIADIYKDNIINFKDWALMAGNGRYPYLAGDITEDCRVDYEDLTELADSWLHEITGPNDPAAIADIHGDNIINFKDWAIMAGNWLECNWQCE